MPLLCDFPSRSQQPSEHRVELISLSLLHYLFVVKSNFLFHVRVTSCHYKHIHAFVVPYKPPQSHKLLCGLLMFFRNIIRNIILNQSPDYFYQQFLKSTNTHNYNTRNASRGHLTLPNANTNFQKHTVIYRSISFWNLLPPHINLTQNKLTFKRSLKTHVLQLTT